MKKPILYKPQKLILDSGTYPFGVMCFINQTNKQVEKTLLNYFDANTIKETDILNTRKAKTVYMPTSKHGRLMIRFNDLHKGCADCFPVIAHEAFHCAEFLFDCIGLPYSIESSESFAYQIEYYCRQLLNKLK